ncbi:DUF4143 domain-containing protein [Erythrobacter sp.]|uniref:DUF4143 domain-containing protein n=1 Tax=Erythrobacter sp. TaxID=1042 RepID=UPI0025FF8704|nr:DUF4143 domain-containing protein [Erythrobacter sp.]
MLSDADLRLIEAHHGIQRANTLALRDLTLDTNSPAASAPPIELESMWHRGRFAQSLLAPDGPASDRWRADNAEDLLPFRPHLPSHSPLATDPWRWIANENGLEESGLFTRSLLQWEVFERLRQTGEQQDVIFRLPAWSPPGEATSRPSFLYMTDSGVLHHLIGLPEVVLNSWDKRPPQYRGGTWDGYRQRSWEGFAISCLARAAGVRAHAFYWTAADGEIDLILDWSSSSECWAIEITIGRNKKLKSYFEIGCGEVQATRAILLHNSVVGIPKIKWDRGMARNLEIMTLEEALLEVDAGP